MKHLTIESLPTEIPRWQKPWHSDYYAMYSSQWNAITTDPRLMWIPLDDHMVHRGDAVFEALKCVQGSLYNWTAHLRRLQDSAARIHLSLPFSAEELTRLVLETARAGQHADCLIRVFLSRGPGGFSVRPSECPTPHLYIIATRLGPPFMTAHPNGARVRSSTIPLKSPFFAQIKSCNYMPNVLMAWEAEQWGVDFTVSFDERDCLGEGSTENAGIILPNGPLLFPSLDRVLPGTTMLRLVELIRENSSQIRLPEALFQDIPRARISEASEFILVGTTIDVASAVEFDGQPIGDGKPGPVAARLNNLLQQDIRFNRSLQTPVGF